MKGNLWFKIKCGECDQQLLSYKNLGLASFFYEDDEDPWRTRMFDNPIRHICIRCSRKMGYDAGN